MSSALAVPRTAHPPQKDLKFGKQWAKYYSATAAHPPTDFEQAFEAQLQDPLNAVFLRPPSVRGTAELVAGAVLGAAAGPVPLPPMPDAVADGASDPAQPPCALSWDPERPLRTHSWAVQNPLRPQEGVRGALASFVPPVKAPAAEPPRVGYASAPAALTAPSPPPVGLSW